MPPETLDPFCTTIPPLPGFIEPELIMPLDILARGSKNTPVLFPAIVPELSIEPAVIPAPTLIAGSVPEITPVGVITKSSPAVRSSVVF